MPNPQSGIVKTLTRWGTFPLLVAAVVLVAYNSTPGGSARSLLLAATFLGAAVGPVVSRCLGNPSLTPSDTARPTLSTPRPELAELVMTRSNARSD